MKKIALSLGLLTCSFLLMGCGGSGNAKPTGDGTAQVCNKTQCFKVDLAVTADQQRQGLMGVEELADDAGMLFVFDNPGVHEFWMKDTLIPLDMIWLDETGEVLYIKEYAPPCTADDSKNNDCQLFGPPEGTTASYVLEVNANKTREAGIYEGITLDLYNIK